MCKYYSSSARSEVDCITFDVFPLPWFYGFHGAHGLGGIYHSGPGSLVCVQLYPLLIISKTLSKRGGEADPISDGELN